MQSWCESVGWDKQSKTNIMHKDFQDLSFDELTQKVCEAVNLSSDKFHESNNESAAYQIIVAERLLNELKARTILTAI